LLGKTPSRPIHPMLVVLSALGIIEIAMTALYPRLTERWEKLPILILLLAIPVSVIATFLYLWVRHPGHLYPPSEFGSGDTAELKLAAFSCNMPAPVGGLEQEFEQASMLLANTPEGESAMCVLPLKKHPDFLYCQCSFSVFADRKGVFKFQAEFDEIVRLLPDFVAQHKVGKVIVVRKDTLKKLRDAPAMDALAPLLTLARGNQ